MKKEKKVAIVNANSFARYYPEFIEKLECEVGQVERIKVPADIKAKDLAEKLEGFSYLIVGTTPKFSEEFFEMVSGLEYVARFGIGYNNVDVVGAKKHAVVVSNMPGVLEKDDVAEQAVALTMALTKHVVDGCNAVHREEWNVDRGRFLGNRLQNKVVGVLGYGNIGSTYGKIMSQAFQCKIITYGLEHEAQYQATDITYDKYGHASFTVLKDGRKAGSFYLKVPGSHNVSNALAAIALARLLQIPNDVIVKGLGSFTGTDRRFQYKGEVAGVTIVDDYAHHPTEIQATLNAAHNYPHKKLWCVFQPHTYTRTKALLPEFAQALKLADHVVLADIYAARETDNLGISSKDLQARIQELGTPCEYFPTFDEIENFLLNNCEAGDLLITMGAGDVVKIGEQLLGK